MPAHDDPRASRLGLVPARGGSKGLPRKNVADVAGRPLLAWTVLAALESGVFDRVVVSTDDDEIAAVAEASGAEVPFRRAASVATDDASAVDVGLDALDRLGEPAWLMLLQPTSPLRTAEDIRCAVAMTADDDVSAVVSVRQVREHPAWMLEPVGNGFVQPWLRDGASRRQDEPELFVPNGAIYLIRSEVLRRERRWVVTGTRAYVMPEHRSIDVDTAWDLWLASQALTVGSASMSEPS